MQCSRDRCGTRGNNNSSNSSASGGSKATASRGSEAHATTVGRWGTRSTSAGSQEEEQRQEGGRKEAPARESRRRSWGTLFPSSQVSVTVSVTVIRGIVGEVLAGQRQCMAWGRWLRRG